ncbi:hypothetical protein T11_52, partial [Trichinella zimbabwensis]
MKNKISELKCYTIAISEQQILVSPRWCHCNETKCDSHEKAFCSFVKEEWILGHKFCLYINCAVNLS